MGEDRLHVIFGTGQVGRRWRPGWPGLAAQSGRCRVGAQGRLPRASTGGRRTPPTLRRPPTQPKAHRSCTSASTPPTYTGTPEELSEYQLFAVVSAAELEARTVWPATSVNPRVAAGPPANQTVTAEPWRRLI